MTVSPAPDPAADIAISPAGPQVGAFFDLDGTLVAGFTPTAHARDRMLRRQASVGEILGVLEATFRYKLGRMEFERLVVRAAGYLRGDPLTDLEDVGERIFHQHNASMIYPKMRELVQAHRRQGHTVVLSSSALTIHAEPVARDLGIAHVLCNHFDVDADGLLTGGIRKPIVWGRNKATAVKRFCESNDVDLQRSYFYADGEEDVDLMTLVGAPCPVNPRGRLAVMAAEHGWPVLRLDDPRPRGMGASLRRFVHLARR
ncbi:HAD-IB family hydrolase [Mycobacterium sp. CBMA271]|uniref:HAD family hydrolase n=1 Tax=unclassified Mycobacteroides TaxID=2618759 RepID=UPI0012DE2825|nr:MULTISPECIES: HAD-IB family hydrolase [unclassified Mycobacteroides]MUM17626.1 haloacid dehalogenase [Mycobacteroides sp. CBMA 326]MUM23099.1 HAD-IB family hydrolase [Mycobacteroides sp. CBMA 271]